MSERNQSVVEYLRFWADPTQEGLHRAPDDATYLLRVGVLLAMGRLRADEARRLLMERGITSASILDSER